MLTFDAPMVSAISAASRSEYIGSPRNAAVQLHLRRVENDKCFHPCRRCRRSRITDRGCSGGGADLSFGLTLEKLGGLAAETFLVFGVPFRVSARFGDPPPIGVARIVVTRFGVGVAS